MQLAIISPRRFRSGAVSVLSSSFTHSISVGCSRPASGGVLVAAWSLNGVGARPVLLNFFAPKPTIEASEPGATVSTMRVPASPLCVWSRRAKLGFQLLGTSSNVAFACVLPCYMTHFTSSRERLLQLLMYLRRRSDSPLCRQVLRPPGEPVNACEHYVLHSVVCTWLKSCRSS